MSSDGGVLLLREIERRMGISNVLASCLADRRDPVRTRQAFPPLEADDIAFAAMFARLNKGPGSASTGRARAAREFRYRPVGER